MKIIAFAILTISPLLADSVTTIDNLTTFGHVDQMNATEVKLSARFSTGPKPMTIPRAQIVKIEFNATTFNSGAPRGAKPLEPVQATPQPPGPDTVILRGGDSKPCQGAVIDGQNVHCGKQEFNRQLVVRVLLGRK